MGEYMGKIKGWSKKSKYTYKNDKTNTILKIDWNNINDIVVFVDKNGRRNKIHSGTFFSESNARHEAINFMKAHPRG